jgi:UTP-glucose-1-phosphate uridylyltransferase
MKTTLLILAAGMGSRYGGLKQMDSIGPSGETIMDYSVFDAISAGITKVVFVIKREFEKDFNDVIIKKYEGKINIDYVFQELSGFTDGIKINPERVKPWGTSHAVLSAADMIKEHFIVINADDFYGLDSFKIVHDYLSVIPNETSNSELRTPNLYAMAGYKLKETLSENGAVTRAVCELDDEQYLKTIVERFKIKRQDNIVINIENNIELEIDEDSLVSMNMWGFTPSIFDKFKEMFRQFIEKNYDNTSAEFLLPACINEIIESGFAKVKVLKTQSEWFGLTYKEDKPAVVKRINQLIASGQYPANVLI